jgi:hypothetical protein
MSPLCFKGLKNLTYLFLKCHEQNLVVELKVCIVCPAVVPLSVASLTLRGNYGLSKILLSTESHGNVMLPSEWNGSHRTARAARKQIPPAPPPPPPPPPPPAVASSCSLTICSAAFFTYNFTQGNAMPPSLNTRTLLEPTFSTEVWVGSVRTSTMSWRLLTLLEHRHQCVLF